MSNKALICPLSIVVTFGDILFLRQVVEDGYEFFAKRHLVTLFSAPNYCGEFDNAGAMMSVDETLLCSFQVRPHLSFSTSAVLNSSVPPTDLKAS
jgi:hypothetical protein